MMMMVGINKRNVENECERNVHVDLLLFTLIFISSSVYRMNFVAFFATRVVSHL